MTDKRASKLVCKEANEYLAILQCIISREMVAVNLVVDSHHLSEPVTSAIFSRCLCSFSRHLCFSCYRLPRGTPVHRLTDWLSLNSSLLDALALSIGEHCYCSLLARCLTG